MKAFDEYILMVVFKIYIIVCIQFGFLGALPDYIETLSSISDFTYFL